MGACVHQPQLYEVCSPRIEVKMTYTLLYLFRAIYIHGQELKVQFVLRRFTAKRAWPKANFDQISKFRSLKF